MDYEFDAPQFCDFATLALNDVDSADDVLADAWFDGRQSDAHVGTGLVVLLPSSDIDGGPVATAAAVDPRNVLLSSESWEAAGALENERHKRKGGAGTSDDEKLSPKRNRGGSVRRAPATPAMLHRAPSAAAKCLKTSEERELEQIDLLKAEVKRQKRLSAESFQRVFDMNPTAAVPKRAAPVKPNVVPILSKPAVGMVLRSFAVAQNLPAPTAAALAPPSVVAAGKPFSFHHRVASSVVALTKPFVALAHQVQKFAGTPPRARRPAPPATEPAHPAMSDSVSGPLPPAAGQPLSSEDLVCKALAAVPQFRARSINPAVLNSAGDYGVPRVEKKLPTEPVTPVLATHARALERSAAEAAVAAAAPPTAPFHFRAQPAPRHVIDGAPVGVPAVASAPVTVAVPFAHVSAHPDPRITRARLLAEAQEKENAQRHFVAQLIPASTNQLAPVVSVPSKPLTRPEPFQLASVARHVAHKEQWEGKVQEEQLLAAKLTAFKAQECVVTKLPPFVPAAVPRAPLTAVDIRLNTQLRAVERAQFDDFVKQKEADEQERKRKAALVDDDLDAKLLKRQRLETVFKAQPVMSSKPFLIMPSSKELTVPVSPCLQSGTRNNLL